MVSLHCGSRARRVGLDLLTGMKLVRQGGIPVSSDAGAQVLVCAHKL